MNSCLKTIGYLNTVYRKLNLEKDFCIKCTQVYSKVQTSIQARHDNVMAYNILTWVGDQHYGKNKRKFLKMKDIKEILEVTHGRPAKVDIEATKRWENMKKLIIKTSSEYNQDLK